MKIFGLDFPKYEYKNIIKIGMPLLFWGNDLILKIKKKQKVVSILLKGMVSRLNYSLVDYNIFYSNKNIWVKYFIFFQGNNCNTHTKQDTRLFREINVGGFVLILNYNQLYIFFYSELNIISCKYTKRLIKLNNKKKIVTQLSWECLLPFNIHSFFKSMNVS